MQSERAATCGRISALSIPHSTIAAIAGVGGSKVSEFVRGHVVSGQAAAKIERTVAEISDVITLMREHFGLRPDLRDIPSLKAAIAELKTARNFIDAQKQLAAVESDASAAMSAIA